MTPNALADTNTERRVLAAALYNGDVVFDIVHALRPESFAMPECAMVFRTIHEIVERGAQPLPEVVSAPLPPKLQDFVTELGELLTDSDAVPDLIARLVSFEDRRRITAAAGAIHAMGCDSAIETEDVVARAEVALSAALEGRAGTRRHRSLADAARSLEVEADRLAASTDDLPGIPTGLPTFDRITRGLRPGQLVVVGGRSSEGKSALAGTIVRAAAARGARCLVFSLEMTAEDWVQRWVAAEGVPIVDQEDRDQLRDPRFRERLRCARDRVARLPIEIVDDRSLTIPAIRTWARKLAAKGPIRLVVVDYLDLVESHDSKHRDRHDLELGARTRALRALAQEIRCPVLVLVQLNREAARDLTKPSGRPQLHHIAGSSKIENDADIIALIHAPGVVAGTDDGQREVLVEKFRRGARKLVIPCRLIGERVLFVEADPHAGDEFL